MQPATVNFFLCWTNVLRLSEAGNPKSTYCTIMLGHILLWSALQNVILTQYEVVRLDPFRHVSHTLHVYEEHTCDWDTVTLKCPTMTKVKTFHISTSTSFVINSSSRNTNSCINKTIEAIFVHGYREGKRKLIS